MKFKILLVLLLTILNCQKKQKEESIIDTFTNVSFLSLAATRSRCEISSSNNLAFFSSGSTPEGGSSPVTRISVTKNNQYFDVYFPTNSSNLPVIVLFQGGNVHSSFYSKYAARIASSGYAVYVGNRCTTFIVQYFIYPPASLGNKALALAKEQNIDSSSALLGKLDTTKVGFLGHSLGGVVAIYAMNNICEFPFCDSEYSFMSEVKGGIFYGSGLGSNFNKSRYFVNQTTGKGIPVGYIQGTLDGANKPATGRASYENSIATKVYFSADGMNHYGITDSNNPFGANPETNSPTIAQSDSISKLSQSTILFLDAFLKSGSISNGNSGISGVELEIVP